MKKYVRAVSNTAGYLENSRLLCPEIIHSYHKSKYRHCELLRFYQLKTPYEKLYLRCLEPEKWHRYPRAAYISYCIVAKTKNDGIIGRPSIEEKKATDSTAFRKTCWWTFARLYCCWRNDRGGLSVFQSRGIPLLSIHLVWGLPSFNLALAWQWTCERFSPIESPGQRFLVLPARHRVYNESNGLNTLWMFCGEFGDRTVIEHPWPQQRPIRV